MDIILAIRLLTDYNIYIHMWMRVSNKHFAPFVSLTCIFLPVVFPLCVRVSGGARGVSNMHIPRGRSFHHMW
jgi:hypothetical protein